jgi:hypothetical protein
MKMTLESQYKLFIESNPENAHWTYQEWLKWHSNKLAESIKNIEPRVSDDFQIGPDGAYEATEDTYGPYCRECEACGEEGCCSALLCKQSESGDYCSGYLRDLRFGYHMYRWVKNNLLFDLEEHQLVKYWEEYDKTFSKFHK